MKTILYMAISIDGKTTFKEDTSWVTDYDVERMDATMKECGVMIMGSRTYYSFGDELPSDQALMVIMTQNNELLAKSTESVLFTDQPPTKVLEMIEEKGFSEVLLAGGETINSSFLEKDLIDEIRVIIKPILIGTGKALVKGSDAIKTFSLESVQKLEEDSVELVYKKLKSV